MTIEFVGSFNPVRFLDFVDHRARRLDLDVAISESGATRMRVTVQGEPDLIDAFEMACSLGPIDCLVRDVFREEAGPGPERGTA